MFLHNLNNTEGLVYVHCHWLASHNPMIFGTPYTPLSNKKNKLNSVLYYVLYTVLYTVFYNILYPDLHISY